MLDFGYYNMDCEIGMKEFPDKYFDIALVDPQYGINAPNMNMGSNKNRKGTDKNGKKQYPGVSTAEKLRKGRLNQGAGKLKDRALNTMNCNWDFEPPSPEYFKELFRISKNQIIFGGNYFDLPPTRGIGFWDKCQPWDNFSQFELIWTSYDCPAFKIKYSNTGGANKEKKIHATQKPIPVYIELLKKFAKSGYKIIDTHVGSASSLIACYLLGYDFVGFEIDKDCYDLSVYRLKGYKKQVRIDDFMEV